MEVQNEVLSCSTIPGDTEGPRQTRSTIKTTVKSLKDQLITEVFFPINYSQLYMFTVHHQTNEYTKQIPYGFEFRSFRTNVMQYTSCDQDFFVGSFKKAVDHRMQATVSKSPEVTGTCNTKVKDAWSIVRRGSLLPVIIYNTW